LPLKIVQTISDFFARTSRTANGQADGAAQMDFQRATQAFIWALPAVGFQGLHLAQRNTFGAKDGEVVLYETLKDKAGMLTPNLTTLYLMTFWNIAEQGPMVVRRRSVCSLSAFPFCRGLAWLGGSAAMAHCEELETSSHNDMVAMDAAIYEILKGDPKFSAFSQAQLSSAEDRACAKHPDAKVIDALRADS
jgi:hypothetical protein